MEVLTLNPRQSKRLKSEESYHSNPTDRDVFDIVLSCVQGAENPSALGTPSSWFPTVRASQAPTMTEEQYEKVRTEIISLSRQLLQVKHRMGPAAERVTEAHNAVHPRYPTTGHQEFLNARRLMNPFERLGEGSRKGLNTRFMNRSAIKLANIDEIINFVLLSSSPKSQRSFYFADLCGAPGGFSEYLMYRAGVIGLSACAGYGISLEGSNEHGSGLEWKLEDSDWTEYGSLFHYRLCDGADGSGDIFNWQNIVHFREYIASDSQQHLLDDEGLVDLVVADGGFDAQRCSDNQEEIAQKLVTCEVASALALLKEKGTLVVKMFGFQSSISRKLVQELYTRFDDVIAMKPISSRPASAERYLVCKGLKHVESPSALLRWRDNIALSARSHESDKYSSLLKYMDAFDRDLLALNTKSCFAILSILEDRYDSIYKRAQSINPHKAVEIDTQTYKGKWKL